MRVLLDTQVWLWMLAAPERLSRKSRTLVVSASNELLLSAASAWEIAIKYRLGKLQLPDAPGKYLPHLLSRTAITPLAVTHRHALHVADLPDHHRDPFDRLLVAQAQIEELPILTSDRSLGMYEVEVIQA